MPPGANIWMVRADRQVFQSITQWALEIIAEKVIDTTRHSFSTFWSLPRTSTARISKNLISKTPCMPSKGKACPSACAIQMPRPNSASFEYFQLIHWPPIQASQDITKPTDKMIHQQLFADFNEQSDWWWPKSSFLINSNVTK